jgi:hypothetical protein
METTPPESDKNLKFPKSNHHSFRATQAAQLRRIGKYKSSQQVDISAKTNSSYQEGCGGQVSTTIRHKRAVMNKAFSFEENGDLCYVEVSKHYQYLDREEPDCAEHLELRRDPETRNMKLHSHQAQGEHLPRWKREFSRFTAQYKSPWARWAF